MAALVADYGDSEDDSDAESEAVEDGRELLVLFMLKE